MSKSINALEKACPMPVVMTKKEIDNGEEYIITQVDNKIAVENLKKLAATTGFSVEVKEEEGTFFVALSKECKACNDMLEQMIEPNTESKVEPKEETKEEPKKETKPSYVVFIGKEFIGDGSQELGKNLMRMFLYTLSESKDLPTHILFMNGGVKLPTLDEQAIDYLKILKKKGVDIIVCGTCLNFYEIEKELKIGTVSNMYDIADKMQQAGKVISF